MIGGLFSHFASRRGFLPVSHSEGEEGGLVDGPPTAGRAAFHISTPGRRLISSLVRRAFGDPEASEDLAGDWPTASELQPSDCWPMEIVTGAVRFHADRNVTSPTQLSLGKSGSVTG